MNLMGRIYPPMPGRKGHIMGRFGHRSLRGIAAVALLGGLVGGGGALVLLGGAAQAGATTGDTDLALSQPSNIVVNTTSPGQTSAVVNYSLPTATDPDGTTPPAPICTPPSGSTFSLGATIVTCTVDLSLAVTAANTQLTLDQAQFVSDNHQVLRDQAEVTVAETALRQAVMQLEAAEAAHADATTIMADQNAAGADQAAADAALNAENIDQAAADADQAAVNADTMALNAAVAQDDDTPDSVSVSFTVSVLGAAGQLSNLKASVVGVGPGQILPATVEAAQSALAAGHVQASCVALRAFVVEVHVLAVVKAISPTTASQLVASATRIESLLPC